MDEDRRSKANQYVRVANSAALEDFKEQNSFPRTSSEWLSIHGHQYETLTSWTSDLEKLTVGQLVKKLPPFIQPGSSLRGPQDPAIGLYPQQDESILYQVLFL
jgi:hypothetical protein